MNESQLKANGKLRSVATHCLSFILVLIPPVGFFLLQILRPFQRPMLIFMASGLVIAYVAALLSIKVPASDLLDYVDWYEAAHQYAFAEYVMLQGKEPFYHALVYLIASIYGSSTVFFQFSMAIIIYGLLLGAIFNHKRHVYGHMSSLWLCVIFCAVLFPPLFNISTQLMRQTVASGIFFYAISISNPRHALIRRSLLLASILTHTSVLILIFFLFLSQFLTKLRGVKFLVTSAALLAASVFLMRAIFLGAIQEFASTSYLASRISQESFFDLGAVQTQSYVLGAAFLVVLVCFETKFRSIATGLRIGALIGLFTILFGSNPLLSEVVIRVSMNLYFLIWVLIFIFCFYVRSPFVHSLVTVVISLWFILNLVFGPWEIRNAVLSGIFTPVALISGLAN